MGRYKIEKGKEFRPRLHDGLPTVSRVGQFIILHLETEAEAEKLEKQKFYVRPDRNKAPVRIA